MLRFVFGYANAVVSSWAAKQRSWEVGLDHIFLSAVLKANGAARVMWGARQRIGLSFEGGLQHFDKEAFDIVMYINRPGCEEKILVFQTKRLCAAVEPPPPRRRFLSGTGLGSTVEDGLARARYGARPTFSATSAFAEIKVSDIATASIASSWPATTILAGRRQLSWPVEGLAGRSVLGVGSASWRPRGRTRAGCPAKGSPTTKCSPTRPSAERTPKPPQPLRPASASAALAVSTRSSRSLRSDRRASGVPAGIRLRPPGSPSCCRCFRRARI
jgi:hypothetical protein